VKGRKKRGDSCEGTKRQRILGTKTDKKNSDIQIKLPGEAHA
jgi:hypothetical protein